jgi:hypothetical protein
MKNAYMWCDEGKHLTGYYVLNSRRDKVCLACATLREGPVTIDDQSASHIAQLSNAEETAFRKRNLFIAAK